MQQEEAITEKVFFQLQGSIKKKYALQEAHIEPPEGCLIKFETNGGTPVAPVRGTNHFEEWMRILPFHGQIDGGELYISRSRRTYGYGKSSISSGSGHIAGHIQRRLVVRRMVL